MSTERPKLLDPIDLLGGFKNGKQLQELVQILIVLGVNDEDGPNLLLQQCVECVLLREVS